MIDLDTFDFDSCTPESLKAAAKEKILEDLQTASLEIDTREGSYTDALLSEAAYMVYNAIMTAPDLMAAAYRRRTAGATWIALRIFSAFCAARVPAPA